MKFCILFFSGLLAMPCLARSRRIDPPPPIEDFYPTPGCPFHADLDWQKFLERSADNPDWVVTCENGACDPDPRVEIEKGVQAVFDRCEDFIASHSMINRCTDRFRRFVKVWLEQHSRDSYGFRIGNHQYFAEQETPDKPAGMMLPPKAIIDALPYRTDVEAAARRAGLRYLTHDSALAGVRTFVFYSDPQGRYDQWLLLNLPNGQGNRVEEVEPMSVLPPKISRPV